MKNVNSQDTVKTKTAEDVRQRYNLDVIKSITSKQTNNGFAIGIGKKAAVSKGLDIAGEIISDDKITANAFYAKTGAELCPVGMSFEWNASSVPTGYLLEDGAAKSRTTYADLFAVIGTQHGVGDGSTTFNLPNSKGRVAVGLDTSQTEFDVTGEKGGAKTHTLLESEMPAHTHGDHMNSAALAPGGTAWPTNTNATTNGWYTGSTGGGGAHNNLQPYIVKQKIIKY